MSGTWLNDRPGTSSADVLVTESSSTIFALSALSVGTTAT